MNIPIEVSARHVHLSEGDFRKLFGEISLEVERVISQPNQFAAKQQVNLQGPQGVMARVRVVGPFRQKTQVELSISDCRKLGVRPHLALSGALEGSSGISVEGPAGTLILDSGVIVAQAHLHLTPSEARDLKLSHLESVTVTIKGERTVSLHDVIVRSREGVDRSALHIDTDEANAIGSIASARIISIEKSGK